jgi:hypothetical protein
MQKFILLIILFTPWMLNAQSNNYWSRNFNEESSLISGAVVGGGAGPSAIFYNPASISEIKESKLSVNASLFSFEHTKASNAWGDNIDFVKSRFYVVPRFLSYMYKPKNNQNLRLEFAFLNNENFLNENIGNVDTYINILKYLPGEQRYNAFYNYYNTFRDDWFGAGGSYFLSNNLSFGLSTFATVKSMMYAYSVDIEAGPRLANVRENENEFFTAKYKDQEFLKFYNYRLLWKLGLLYKRDRISFGLNVTTPSVNVLSSGKRVMRKKSQSNITYPINNLNVPNFLISGYAEKKEVSVNYKTPFSIATGMTIHNHDSTKTVYTTIEYFGKMKTYRMVEATENLQMVSGILDKIVNYDEWLTYINGAEQVFNAAIGYRWNVKKDFMVMAGFRTDFNYRKRIKSQDLSPFEENKLIKGFNIDKYHFTGGITTKVFGQDIMAGLQYSIGIEKDQKQFANLSDPVEYNPDEHTALQGIRQNSMDVLLNSLSLYFGATINFESGKKQK